MELKIPIEVDFDDMKALIDDFGKLQKYKLFDGDEMILVDADDVADVLIKHIKAKEAPLKTGKWTIKNGELAIWDVCSVCGKMVIHKAPFYNYCPNCGSYNGE